jgi:KDO2-lipid IV(A) lauroyltransferase
VIVLLRLALATSAAVPLSAAHAIGRALGTLFYLLAARQRRRAVRNLIQCFPALSRADARRTARRVFGNIGVNQLEMLRWLAGRADELKARIAVTGLEHLEEARAGGAGVIVLTAHVGNWDLLALWAASQWPLTIISKDIKHSVLNAFWMEQRRQAGLRIVAARNSYRACLAALRRGEMLGFVLDQNMIRRDGIFVDFFGRPACTTPGLAMLSAHAGAPVMPAFMLRRRDGRHEVRMLPLLAPPASRKPDAIAAATQQYTRLIEKVVRQHADQWIWMHRRWRTQPRAPQEAGPQPVLRGSTAYRASGGDGHYGAR